MNGHRHTALTAKILFWAAGLASPLSPAQGEETAKLAVAEQFIDAFYAFDARALTGVLVEAGESRQEMLFYQGWAQGGNYIIVDRAPCRPVNASTASCSITVQDDLVLALGIDFDVTDTFELRFEGSSITSVETSSNDTQLYHDARDWVWEHRPELLQLPCKGTEDLEPDPAQCVRGMLQGYREYARLRGLTPRHARPAL